MFMLVACLLVLLYTKHAVFACLLVVIYLAYAKPWSKGGTPEESFEFAGSDPGSDVENLALLRLELDRLLAEGAVDRAFHGHILDSIDIALSELLEELGAVQGSEYWKEGREAAWELLVSHELIAPGAPPWDYEERAGLDAFAEKTEEESAAGLMEAPLVPPAAAASPVQTAEAKVSPDSAPSAVLAARSEENLSPSGSEPHRGESAAFAWKPSVPDALERALRSVSGWPALVVPFLVQNIGWFIGGLCVVAGSVFLVSYTSGFAKALTVSAVLFAYTLFILWAGYQLRRRRPELETSSNVLLSLGVLLVPLNIASSVRVIADGQNLYGLVTGIFIAASVCTGLYYATMLVSAIMDRSLQGRHPQLFLALAGTQMAVPLLTRFPSWPLMALFHILLLGLLSYGLVLFTRDWLHCIFAQGRKIAYYAAGTLVYAALVSFVHITWGYTEPHALPGGYYSPFLMALCGLLFYVDSQLKQWAKQYAFLSRLCFAIYGLSILALALSVDVPAARLVTLVLAVGVYGLVLWQYLTLPPLYLLFACLSWLYGMFVLQHVPAHWHMLASLPGLALLFSASRWLQRRRSYKLALICYRIWMGMAVALAGWSLPHARPGLPAMGTALALMGLFYCGLRFAPDSLFGDREEAQPSLDLRDGPWLYAVTAMGCVAVAYAPQWTGMNRETQCAFGLVLSAVVWAALGLRLHRIDPRVNAARNEVLFNSALLNLGLCLVPAVLLALPGITTNRALPLLPVSMGGVSFWLCFRLRERLLFYGALALWGAAGAIFKLTYFPEPSTGAIVMSLALAVWGLLWWLEREAEEIRALRREQAALPAMQQPPMTFLRKISVSGSRTYEEMLCRPLQQTMGLLWLIGMAQLGARFIGGSLGWAWTLSCLLSALVSILAGGYFRQTWSVPFAVLLGLGAWLTCVFNLRPVSVAGLSFAGAVYALLGWRLTVHVLAHPASPPLAKKLHLGGDRVLAEGYVHILAFSATLLSIGISLAFCSLYSPSAILSLTLATSSVFLWLSGQRYHQRFHSYTLSGIGVLGAVLCYVWIFPHSSLLYTAPVQWLINDRGLGLCLGLFALALWIVAHGLDRLVGAGEEFDADFSESLYRKPLRVVAVGLSLGAGIRQLALVWSDPASAVALLSIIVLLLASISLLLANHALRHFSLNLAGILFAVLSVLMVEAALFHRGEAFTLLPDFRGGSDLWLAMSLLGFGLAALSEYASRYSRWEKSYTLPLRTAAALTCGWALLSTLMLFLLAPLRVDAFLPLSFTVLILCLFPLLKSLPNAATIRSVSIPVLCCPVITGTLASAGLSHWTNFAALIWGYALWGLENFFLPRWNARRPQWVIAPGIWPWMGLVAVSLSLAGSILDWSRPISAFAYAGYQAACAVYLLLLLQNSAWPGFSWLAALLLNYTGLTLNAVGTSSSHLFLPELTLLTLAPPLGCLVGNLLWTNLLLRAVPLWRQHGKSLSTRWGWRSSELTAPFLIWPSFLFSLWLLQLFFQQVGAIGILPLAFPVAFPMVQWSSPVLVGLLLSLSFLHVWWLHRASWEAHALLFSLFCTFLAGSYGIASHLVHLPLILALWSGALLLAHSVWEARGRGGETTRMLRRSLFLWLIPGLIVAMAALILVPEVSLSERLLTLMILIGVAAVLGLQRRQNGWLVVAVIMVMALLHAWPLLWVPFHRAPLLSAWYALQSALFVWLLLYGGDILQRHLERSGEAVEGLPVLQRDMPGRIVLLCSRMWPAISLLALGEWALNGYLLFESLAANSRPQRPAGGADAAAALLAALLLLLVGMRHVRKSQQPAWIYGVVAFCGAIGLYIRLLLVGLAPLSVWDTAALMGATYLLLIIQQLTLCKPLLHVVLVMPLFALLTVPIQLASPFAGVTLVSCGVLYLLAHRADRRPLPLYLGLLAFNGAVYLWIPGWAAGFHIFQVYVLPAAISVLLLLHLHRKELKPSVLNSARLTATSILYAGATLDVFLRGELAVFALVLFLSLAGVITGIALRTRAFLYSGVAFLVLNILGQLVFLFPEQRLGKAIILLVLGVLITGGMIWFNVQRGRILRRIRIFRADLQTWV